jgi:hypothetical protein
LLGSTCLFLAEKVTEVYCNDNEINNYVFICDNTYTAQQFLETEIDIVNVLGYYLYRSTECTFLNLISRELSISDENYRKSLCLLYLAILDMTSRTYKPEDLALAAILNYSQPDEDQCLTCYNLIKSSKDKIDECEKYLTKLLNDKISIHLNEFFNTIIEKEKKVGEKKKKRSK